METIVDQKDEGNDIEKGCANNIVKVESIKAGGWNAMPYIMGNETFEKLASMSLIANLVVYLRTQYNLDGIAAVTIFTVWHGTCNFAPLLGAFISDAYIGKFKTLIFGSLSSTLGMVVLAITAALPHLRPHPCLNGIECEQAKPWQLSILMAGLGFLVLGAGGIRPCNIAFGVDQFDIRTEKGKKDVESFYNWYYLTFTLALLIALTVVVYIQNSISWAWGLALPATFMVLSVLVFLAGSHLYVYVLPNGSVFGGMVKVVVAAFRKRHLTGLEYSLYEGQTEPGAETKMAHTERFKCLDKAAVITDRDVFDDKGLPVNEWRLCSIKQVEQLKSLIGILPVWASGITCFIIMDQQHTFGVQQAMQTDTHIRKFQVPPGSLGLTSMIALSIYIPIYEHVLLPFSRKVNKKGIMLGDRMKAGIVMSILCMLSAGLLEGKRRDSALKNGSFVAPMSFVWLLPQFAFSGLTEALMGISLMEFFNSHLPANMRTVAGAFVFLNLAMAGYLNTCIVNSISSSRLHWLGGRDLNKNRLDYYYFTIGGLAVINFIYFMTFARRYVVNNDSMETVEAPLETTSNKDNKVTHDER
ncbi:hypothetical protein AQUCO_00200466v1 [Aquilegia coerulea]|uniref:Major facilitator superfamily (MFS) profile domain-containing protein n=1 Tax=Aquilegia coerulea TaxID=218851 RepID=A0A2G5F3A3_AQUCA|nr:hypothetical protein AQUCO_00200466v1 [Aquilegia coerulea]